MTIEDKILIISSDKAILDCDKAIVSAILSEKVEIFLKALSGNHNLVNSRVIELLLEKGYIDYENLTDIGVDRDFLRELVVGERSSSLGGPSYQLPCEKFVGTELLFFGLRNSGTTSLLGSILSSLASGKYVQSICIKEDSVSYDYAIRLSNWCKQSHVTRYLQSNISNRTQCFDVDIKQSSMSKAFRFVKMNSDLSFCLYKRSSFIDGLDQEYAYTDYTNLLSNTKTSNRKLFFFVIPYEESDVIYEGLSRRSTYLESMIRTLESDKIFDKHVDAIYFVLTKLDIIPESLDIESSIKNFILSRYNEVYNGLIEICRNYAINDGTLPIIPFSCGETCFQDIVKINELSSEHFINNVILKDMRINPPKRIQKILQLFRK